MEHKKTLAFVVFCLNLVLCSCSDVVVTRASTGSGKAVDFTLVPGASGVDVVDACIQKINYQQIFVNDFNLVRRIALVESRFGTNSTVIASNELGGIWQISQDVTATLQQSSILQTTISQLSNIFGFNLAEYLTGDYRVPLFSAVIVRLYVQAIQGSNSVPGSLTEQAQWWSEYYHPGGQASHFERIVAEYEDATRCSVYAMDLWFLVDSSGSVGEKNFKTALDFVDQVSQEFNISKDQVRTGLSVYSSADKNKIISNFNQHKSNEKFSKAVQGTKYTQGGTATGAAIDYVVAKGFKENGVRPLAAAVPRVLIVLTDGKSNDDVTQPSEDAREDGITLFGIGIGNVNKDEIDVIANDPDSQFAFKLDKFDQLLSFLKQSLSQGACEISAEIQDNTTVSTVIPAGNTYYSTAQLPVNGSIEIVLDVNVGLGVVYMSTSTVNPNSAFNEISVFLSVGINVITVNAGAENSLVDLVDRSTRQKRDLQTSDTQPLYIALEATGDRELKVDLKATGSDARVVPAVTTTSGVDGKISQKSRYLLGVAVLIAGRYSAMFN